MGASQPNNISRGRVAGGPEIAAALLFLVAGGFAFARVADTPSQEVELAGYATDLKPRTPAQRFNAARAADSLNGCVIPAGATFSFNHAVKSWTQDQGYVKAPVSYDGELIKEFGGGVCQTSTTLYNAALLAGMQIVERHHHVFAPHYVPPGRDAAVAQYNIDLRFRNPYPWPVRIHTATRGGLLDIRMTGSASPKDRIEVASDVLTKIEPERLTRLVYRSDLRAGTAFIRNPGATGFRVVTYRTFYRGGEESRQERLGDDTYEAMNHIIQVDDPMPAP